MSSKLGKWGRETNPTGLGTLRVREEGKIVPQSSSGPVSTQSHQGQGGGGEVASRQKSGDLAQLHSGPFSKLRHARAWGREG